MTAVTEVDKAAAPASRLELGLAGGGYLRWAVADLTDVVQEARDRHDMGPVATAALGRCMAGAALLLRLAAKTPTRLSIEVRGDGPILRVLAEADQEGNLRGLVGHPQVDVPHWSNHKLAVGRAVGKGHLWVRREFSRGGGYQSQVELVNGEIGEDLAHYLQQSEQTSSAVLLGVLGKPSGVAAAGGMIVEVLPGAPEAAIDQLEQNIFRIHGISELLEAGGLPHVKEMVLSGMDHEVKEVRPLQYRCRCSRERLLQHLVLLSADDRDYLRREDGTIDADCVFCGTHYVFTPEELLESPAP
jgi:molecular chaperone Hsp33